MMLIARSCMVVALGVGAALIVGCNEAGASSNSEPATLAGECGEKGLPDCPTQEWMKATLQAHLKAQDFDRLAPALEELAAKQPDGYQEWAAIAKAGAKAATAKDDAAVRASCKACHSQYKAPFKANSRRLILL